MAPLQPIQQTVFEQGPQSAPVPTAAPAFVFQEEQVIRPEPINPVQATDPGIAWNALGAEAMGIASNLYEKTLDFLIRTKTNKVADLQDKYESQLNELYQKQTTELYNANKTKRPRDVDVVKTIYDGIQEAKQNFKKDAIAALGEDTYFRDDFDFSTLGTKYQELALLSRRALRNIDTQASKLLYDTQRVANEVQKKEIEYSDWIYGIGARPEKGRLPTLGLTGQGPLPMTQDGKFPIIGFNRDTNGNYTTVKTVRFGNDENSVEVPAVIQTEDGWVLNPKGMAALDWEEFNKLIDVDLDYFGSSSGVVSKATGQLTADLEERFKQILRYPGANQGETAYFAALTARLPDNLYQNMVTQIDGLTLPEKTVADMLRLYARNGGNIDTIGKIQGMDRVVLEPNAIMVNKIATEAEGIHVSAVGGPGGVPRMQRAQKILAELMSSYGAPVTVEDLVVSSIQGSYYTDTDALSAHAILRDNPGLKAPLVQILTLLDSNPNINIDDPVELGKLFESAVNRSNYVLVTNSNTGIPNVVYAPNLTQVNRVRHGLQTGELLTPEEKKALPEDYIEQLSSDPLERDRVLAQSYLFSTDWADLRSDRSARTQAMDIAKIINPFVNMPTFEALYDAGVTEEESSKGFRTQAALPFGQLLRMVVAASPTAMEAIPRNDGTSFVYREGMELPVLLEAAKRVWDDMDPTNGKDLVELGFSLTSPDMNYVSAPRGGIPLQLKQIKGTSGTDYFSVITRNVSQGLSRELGFPFTPRYTDGIVPVMALKADVDPTSVSRYESLRKDTLKYLNAKAGKYQTKYVAAVEGIAPGLGEPNPEVIISRATAPTFKPGMELLRDMDKPLSSLNSFTTFLVINNNAIWGIMKSDPNLATLRKLPYEVAQEPGGRKTYDPNKTLFSEANLEKLFEQAVKRGATTNADMLGYMFTSMHLYQQNDASMIGREVGLENNTNSSPEDFLGKEGRDKNVVLYTPQSDEFYKGVWDHVQKGFNLYQKNNKYYMMTPTDLPSDEVERRKYRLVIDAMQPDTFELMSQMSAMQQKRQNAKTAQSIVFKPQPKPTNTAVSKPTPVPIAVPTKVETEWEKKQRMIQEDWNQKQEQLRRDFELRNSTKGK